MTGPRRSSRQAELQPKTYKESDDEVTDSEEEESEDPRYGQSRSSDDNNRSKNSPSSSFLNFSQTSQTSSPGSSSSPSFNTSPGGKKMYPNLSDEIDGSPSLHKSTHSLYPTLSDSETTTPRSRARETVYYDRRGFNLSPKDLNNCKKQDNLETKGNVSKNKECLVYITLIFIVFISLIVYLYRGTGTSESSKTSYNDGTSYRKYIQDIENLSQQFPKQKKRLWTTVKASAHHILNETHSDYPSVIMMATDIHTNNLALCLAKLITSKFQSAGGNPQHPPVVDVDTLKYMQNMEQKKSLDDRLYEVLSKHKSVIIDNLQMLSAEAALLLHSYCDNDNAPYKDVMIVLMFYIDSSVHLLDADRPNSVERYVEKLWIKDLDIDKVSAILSRVANNIVVVSDEETLPKTLCSDV